MHTEIVYIFPDTMPKVAVLFPLVQIFKQVALLRPVENDPPPEEELTPLLREMMDLECLAFICPVPLLDDRDRFLNLIHDLRHRPDDYASQLSRLSLAGLGGIEGREQETEHSIINTLLQQTGIQTATGNNTPEYEKEQADKQCSMLLWQARLLLNLGEIVDKNQKTVQQSLHRIALRENALLQDLRKTEKTGKQFVHHFDPTDFDDLSSGQRRLRLKAWSQLFAAGQRQTQSATFITWSREAFDSLLERYSQEYSTEPKYLLTLPLPAVLSGNDFAGSRNRFQENAAEMINSMRNLLDNSAFLEEKKAAWADLLEQHYPAEKNGRCRLSLYSLSAISPEKLFLDTFSHGEDDILRNQFNEQFAETGTVLGIIEKLL